MGDDCMGGMSGIEHLKHWQKCEMPGCSNDVPTAKAICDDCVRGGSA